MQLNIYVPRDQEHVLHALDEAVRTTGKAKNLLVLDAIEQYLRELPAGQPTRQLRTYKLGIRPWTRAELYEERADHIMRDPDAQVAEEPATYQTEA